MFDDLLDKKEEWYLQKLCDSLDTAREEINKHSVQVKVIMFIHEALDELKDEIDVISNHDRAVKIFNCLFGENNV